MSHDAAHSMFMHLAMHCHGVQLDLLSSRQYRFATAVVNIRRLEIILRVVIPLVVVVINIATDAHFLLRMHADQLALKSNGTLTAQVRLMAGDKPWLQHGWLEQSQNILDSYFRLLGHHLIDRQGTPAEQAKALYGASFVVVSHGTQADPLLNYANAIALDLWKISIPKLLETPSRMTAETMHRDERARLLARTTRDGYVDDYSGIRIATDGQRFQIHEATVWNLADHNGNYVGQAATFDRWTLLTYD